MTLTALQNRTIVNIVQFYAAYMGMIMDNDEDLHHCLQVGDSVVIHIKYDK